MTDTNTFLIIAGILLLTGIIAGSLTARIGFPFLLLFLAVGMLAGEDGIGGILFDDFELAFLVGSASLAVILLDGGMRTKVSTFRAALWPSTMLATLGVVITAGSVGAFAIWLLDIPWQFGLLLGAIVGSTDAAAVFNVLRNSGVKLNERVGGTLEIESGANDPMAILLVIILVQLSVDATQVTTIYSFASLFLTQFGLGAAFGLAGGYLLSALLTRMNLSDGLFALLILAFGMVVFSGTNLLGGSGFLAIYLLGLKVGNADRKPSESVLQVMDGLAWLAQAGMFLILGLLITPSHIIDNILVSIAIAFFLIFLARPVAVLICLLPFRFRWQERFFISWVGLRGAVPIVLALYPVMAGIEGARDFFDITFVIVLISLLVQGATVAPVARWLKVLVPNSPAPKHSYPLINRSEHSLEVAEFVVESGSPVHSDNFNPAHHWHHYPKWIAHIRADQSLPVEDNTKIEAGDSIWLLMRTDDIDDAALSFARQDQTSKLAINSFFGEFIINPEAPIADLAFVYGVSIKDEGSVEAFLKARLGKHPIVGDRVKVGALRLTIRRMEGDNIMLIGLKVNLK
ncbi:MAG: potassium/proton antiporter [Bermanella sp.]